MTIETILNRNHNESINHLLTINAIEFTIENPPVFPSGHAGHGDWAQVESCKLDFDANSRNAGEAPAENISLNQPGRPSAGPARQWDLLRDVERDDFHCLNPSISMVESLMIILVISDDE